MRRVVALSLLVILLLGAPTIVGAAESPQFEVFVPENIVEPGEESTLDIEIRNDAEPPTDPTAESESEARNVSVELEETDAPISVKSNASGLQTMESGTLLSESMTIAVDEDADPGVHELDLRIDFAYNDSDDFVSDSVIKTIELKIEDVARFGADTIESTIQVNDRGTVSLNITNTANETAHDAIADFTVPDEDLEMVEAVDQELTTPVEGSQAFLGDLAPNETRTVELPMELTDHAVPRTYALSGVISFRDAQGIDQSSRTLRMGVPTMEAQHFSFDQLESNLVVGEDGSVYGNVVNHGPVTAESVVLQLEDDDELFPDLDDQLGPGMNVFPRETQYAVGDLEPGEVAPVEFKLGVGDEAEPGQRVMDAEVRYRVDNEVRTAMDSVEAIIDIAASRDEFTITPINATLAPGESGEIVLDITNTQNETITDIEAKAFPNDPLDGADHDAFIPHLESGETATITYEVDVESGTAPQFYPLRIDFRYDDAAGDSQLSDTYRVPIEVVETEDGLLSTWMIGSIGGGLLFLLGLGYYYRDRLRSMLSVSGDGIPGSGDEPSHRADASDSIE